ncbi:bifunctional DNA primase/polymerase [Cryobacterium sp. TmT2-59]|uniref:Bifunctional DNA primase/polymerase n=1 Tax=Cryobacterium shii TaxID=1259235 RepID=A0AAQ2C573_9MICO|nr:MULTISPECIES: bifunctional DNA primase/polymerase [Cryobacterium]TFC44881.1 bifunctional DNA primase/polymerase [Cryobacterium shii]TFC82145.1 bifunctional DNA primase/polymerase [Cryobacterium sp. TmT2-59]
MDIARLLASVTGHDPTTAARQYAEAGIPVFPCAAGGKRPLTTHGFHDASTDPSQVARWWARWPRANVGMPTGTASGLEVVDVDVHGAIRGFAAFERARREGLTDHWAAFVRTPSGGIHAYYPADPDQVQPSWQAASAGIDFRGAGGYVVVPPSVVVTGVGPSSYELISAGKSDPVPVDARALRDFLQPRPVWPAALAATMRRSVDLDVERIARWVATRGEGERNRGLFWASCRLAESGLAPDSIRAALAPAAEHAGLPTPEVAATIRSAHRAAAGAAAPASVHVEEPRLTSRPSMGQVLS